MTAVEGLGARTQKLMETMVSSGTLIFLTTVWMDTARGGGEERSGGVVRVRGWARRTTSI